MIRWAQPPNLHGGRLGQLIRPKLIWLLAGLLCLALAIAAVTLLRDDPWERHMAAGAEAYQQGNYTEAVKQVRAAVERAREFGPTDLRLGTSLNNLAGLYQAQGHYSEAEPLYQRSLAIAEKALGPEHPNVGINLSNLAELYRVQGRYAEAEPLHQRALAILEKALGPEHPDVGASLENYAALLWATGRSAEAEKMETRAKAIRAKHPQGN